MDVSPRKSHDGKVPRWLYKSHGRRTKQVVMGPYDCPECGIQGIVIRIDQKTEQVLAKCSCGFSAELAFCPSFQPVDYYGKLIDTYYKTKT